MIAVAKPASSPPAQMPTTVRRVVIVLNFMIISFFDMRWFADFPRPEIHVSAT